MERRNGQHPNDPHPDIFEHAENILRAWDLKAAGKSYKQVAEELGCSISTAHKYVQEAFKSQMPPSAEHERLLMVQQYDNHIGDILAQVDNGVDPDQYAKLMNTLEKYLHSKRQLLGLDAPTKFQGTIGVAAQADLDIQLMIDRFHAEEARTSTPNSTRKA